jgi:hypothetical protein
MSICVVIPPHIILQGERKNMLRVPKVSEVGRPVHPRSGERLPTDLAGCHGRWHQKSEWAKEAEMRHKGLDCGTVSIMIVVVGVVSVCVLGALQTYRSRKAADPFKDMADQAKETRALCFSRSPDVAAP